MQPIDCFKRINEQKKDTPANLKGHRTPRNRGRKRPEKSRHELFHAPHPINAGHLTQYEIFIRPPSGAPEDRPQKHSNRQIQSIYLSQSTRKTGNLSQTSRREFCKTNTRDFLTFAIWHLMAPSPPDRCHGASKAVRNLGKACCPSPGRPLFRRSGRQPQTPY